jgi:NCS1 family nucleobase:cation symporter-1
VRWFEDWAAPIVLVMALALLIYVVVKAGGFGPIFTNES